MKESLSLAALLAHPNAGNLDHIAGPRDVSWSTSAVVSDLSALPQTGAGCLLISAESLPAQPWLQDALIRRLYDRGFTGIALPSSVDVSRGSSHLAERFALTVLNTKDPIATARACWQLEEAKDALVLDYVGRVVNAFDYPAADLSDLLNFLAKKLGHGVAVIDGTHTIHDAGSRLPESVRQAIEPTGWLTHTLADGIVATSIRVESAGRSGLRLVLFDEGLNSAQVRALSTAAQVMMPAVAARVMIDDMNTREVVAASAELLREFLDLRGARDADVERRMLEREWRSDGHHLGFNIQGRTRVDAMGLYRAASQELRAHAVTSHVTLSGSNVIGWLTLPESSTTSAVEDAASVVRTVHMALRHTFNVATGVGSLQTGVSGLATTLNEAGDAARLAQNRSTTNYLLRVDSLGLEQLLLAWTRNDTFLPAAQSLLDPLKEDSAELLTTLAVYLDHESGIQATASALGLHRNTVSTRIARAQELLGVDFSAPEARLALHLACRALLDQGF